MHTNKLRSDSSAGRVQRTAVENACFMSSENMNTLLTANEELSPCDKEEEWLALAFVGGFAWSWNFLMGSC